MNVRKRVAAGAVVLGLSLSAVASGAQAVPNPEKKFTVTAGCQVGEGDPFFVGLLPLGSVAFVLDESGQPTGEKLFILSLDVAGWVGGTLVYEFHKEYGKRTGHGEQVFCTGSFVPEPGVLAFFDVLATRR